jgi:hypothetical protein
VSIHEAAQWLGLEVDTRGKALCPFHPDAHKGNFGIFERDGVGLYQCFACGAKGDVISLVSRFNGVNSLEAVRQLNDVFGLGLNVDRPPRRAKSRVLVERQKDAKSRKIYERWNDMSYDGLCKFNRLFHHWALTEQPLSDKWCAAKRNIDYCEYLLDELFKHMTYKERAEIEHIDPEIFGKAEEVFGQICASVGK